jgi:hypothetical protein
MRLKVVLLSYQTVMHPVKKKQLFNFLRGKRHCGAFFVTVRVGHFKSLVIWTCKKLEALDPPLHCSPVDVDGGMHAHHHIDLLR